MLTEINFANELNFKLFLEMAVLGSEIKKPVNIDKDDLLYLEQFPIQFWDEAFHARYDALFDRIKKLSEIDASAGISDLRRAISDGLNKLVFEGVSAEDSWESTRKWRQNPGARIPNIDPFPKEKFIQLEESFKQLKNLPSFTKKMLIYRTARTQALEHFRQFITWEDLRVNDEEKVKLPLGDQRIQTVTFLVKLHLDRLYQKLEKTGKHEKYQDVLGDTGQYGYDLSYPQEGQENKQGNKIKSTIGMDFPTLGAIQRRLQAYFGKIEERVFMPEGYKEEDLKSMNWMALPKPFTTDYVNELVEEEVKNQNRLRSLTQGKFETVSDLKQRVREEARRIVKEKIKNGEITGPPVYSMGEDRRIFKLGETSAKKQNKGNIPLADSNIYVPTKKVTISKIEIVTKQDGTKEERVVEEEVDVPLMANAFYITKVNRSSLDYFQSTYIPKLFNIIFVKDIKIKITEIAEEKIQKFLKQHYDLEKFDLNDFIKNANEMLKDPEIRKFARGDNFDECLKAYNKEMQETKAKAKSEAEEKSEEDKESYTTLKSSLEKNRQITTASKKFIGYRNQFHNILFLALRDKINSDELEKLLNNIKELDLEKMSLEELEKKLNDIGIEIQTIKTKRNLELVLKGSQKSFNTIKQNAERLKNDHENEKNNKVGYDKNYFREDEYKPTVTYAPGALQVTTDRIQSAYVDPANKKFTDKIKEIFPSLIQDKNSDEYERGIRASAKGKIDYITGNNYDGPAVWIVGIPADLTERKSYLYTWKYYKDPKNSEKIQEEQEKIQGFTVIGIYSILEGMKYCYEHYKKPCLNIYNQEWKQIIPKIQSFYNLIEKQLIFDIGNENLQTKNKRMNRSRDLFASLSQAQITNFIEKIKHSSDKDYIPTEEDEESEFEFNMLGRQQRSPAPKENTGFEKVGKSSPYKSQNLEKPEAVSLITSFEELANNMKLDLQNLFVKQFTPDKEIEEIEGEENFEEYFFMKEEYEKDEEFAQEISNEVDGIISAIFKKEENSRALFKPLLDDIDKARDDWYEVFQEIQNELVDHFKKSQEVATSKNLTKQGERGQFVVDLQNLIDKYLESFEELYKRKAEEQKPARIAKKPKIPKTTKKIAKMKYEDLLKYIENNFLTISRLGEEKAMAELAKIRLDLTPVEINNLKVIIIPLIKLFINFLENRNQIMNINRSVDDLVYDLIYIMHGKQNLSRTTGSEGSQEIEKFRKEYIGFLAKILDPTNASITEDKRQELRKRMVDIQNYLLPDEKITLGIA